MKYIYEVTVLVGQRGVPGLFKEDFKFVTREKGIDAIKNVWLKWLKLYGRGFEFHSIDSFKLIKEEV